VKIRTHRKRAEAVFGRLLQALQDKEYPYNLPWVTPPQARENLPPSLKLGTREHALFLFCACYYMRGGIESYVAIRALAEIYERYPMLFLPERIDDWQKEKISDILRSVGLGFQASEISRNWVLNFRRLRDEWWSDPTELLRGVKSYKAACARIKNNGKKKARHRGFYGFQGKMVSMLIYFLMDAGFVDRFHFPIPVDFHVLRVVFANRLITTGHAPSELNGNGLYIEAVLASVRRLVYRYCRRHRVNPVRLCDAVWLLSYALCAQYPGNLSTTDKKKKGRKTRIDAVPLVWSPAQVRTYERSCGRCPVQRTCTYAIPSANYYIQGKLVIRGPRKTPPQQHLFLDKDAAPQG